MAAPEASPQPSPRETAALGDALEHRRIATLVALVGPVPLGAVGLAAAALAREEAAASAFGVVLLSGLVLLAVARRLRRRMKSLDAGAEPTRRAGRPTSLALALAVLGAVLLWRLALPRLPWRWTGGESLVLASPNATLAFLAAVTTIVGALLARFYRGTSARVVPEAPGVAAWSTVAALLSLLAGLALVVRGRGWEVLGRELDSLGLAPLALHAGHLVLGAIAFELAAQALLARPRGRLAAAAPVSLRLVGSRWNPISSLFAYLTDAFGIDLRGTWALGFIQRSLLPIGLVVATVGWLATSFVVVEIDERGVLETFGRRTGEAALEPGLHVVAPWPIQRVQRVSVDRVRSRPIGFQGELAGASLLWTRQHAEQEYSLLLGDGRDLVAVNAALHYRVRDPFAWLYANADPDAALGVVADRVLMRETVGRTLDGVLSENLAQLSTRLREGIQAGADELELGVEVVDLTLLGLHPPTLVAKDYQAVVSAQVLMETRRLEAEAYGAEALPRAQARGTERREGARAEAVRRLATARGEAATFEGHLESYRSDPELYRFRRTLEAQETFLADQPFVVLDHRLERDGATVLIEGGAEPASTGEER